MNQAVPLSDENLVMIVAALGRITDENASIDSFVLYSRLRDMLPVTLQHRAERIGKRLEFSPCK